MSRLPRLQALTLSGLFVLLVLFAVLVLVAAGPAAAGPRADSVAFIPFVASQSPQAVDEYQTEFSGSIDPWKAVRWQKGTDFTLEHNDGCENSLCEFLDIQVNSKDSYVIASPLITGPGPSYDILIRAKLKDRQDKAQYGVIFAGDWQSGPCPAESPDGCFSHYYEFRVRYRDVNNEKYLEYRIRRVDGHDANNIEQGEDLLEWTRADGVNPDDFVKWEIHYGSSGQMRIKANNSEMAGSPRDSTYIGSRLFGVYVRAAENGNGRALFDRFYITKSQ